MKKQKLSFPVKLYIQRTGDCANSLFCWENLEEVQGEKVAVYRLIETGTIITKREYHLDTTRLEKK